MLYEELDEFTECLFFTEGSYLIGYTINRQPKYPMRLKGNTQIGAYGVTFNKRTLFIYKTVEQCKGFFIRKQKWIDIINNEDNESFLYDAKLKIRSDYIKNIKSVLLECKEFDIRKLTQRADYENVLSLQNVRKDKIS